jgi:hypothetical protein
MNFKTATATLFSLFFASVLFANDTAEASASSGGNIDWFQIIISAAYLIGVFILLPIVVYTNHKAKLYNPSGDDEGVQVTEDLDEETRNERSEEILIAIENKLTAFTDENGEEMITITKGRQARFMKNGLDYINKVLKPTNADLRTRVDEFAEIYNIRTKRVFTGSKWIIGASIGVGVLMLFTGGVSTFIFRNCLSFTF